MSGGVHYVFVILPKRRRRPNLKFEGLLERYYFRIYYYYTFPDEDPVEVIKEAKPTIVFPVINHDEILQFGYELGGKKVGEYRLMLKALKQEYVADVVGFEYVEDYHRHMTYALTASVIKSKNKVDLLRGIILTKNQGFITLMANLALELYKDYYGRLNWHNAVLRVGRAVRTLFGLGR